MLYTTRIVLLAPISKLTLQSSWSKSRATSTEFSSSCISQGLRAPMLWHSTWNISCLLRRIESKRIYKRSGRRSKPSKSVLWSFARIRRSLLRASVGISPAQQRLQSNVLRRQRKIWQRNSVIFWSISRWTSTKRPSQKRRHLQKINDHWKVKFTWRNIWRFKNLKRL